MTAKALKIATYNLGERGVVITKSPVHGEDGELAYAQNAVPYPEGGLSGIHKRFGFLALNATAAAGPILAFISAALTDPGVTPPNAYAFGLWLYTADGGATWAYLDVAQQTALEDIPPTIVSDTSLAFLQALDGTTTGQVAGAQEAGANVWDATTVPSAGHDQGRVPYVIPKCLSVDGNMYYWTDTTGTVRRCDLNGDHAAWALGVTAALDWCTDGTSIYVLVTEAGVQRVYAVLLADYSSAQLGDDLDFRGICIEALGSTLYVGGARDGSGTTSTAVIASMPIAGGAWTVEVEEGDYITQEATKATATFTPTISAIYGLNLDVGDVVTVGDCVYTVVDVPTAAFQVNKRTIDLAQAINTSGPTYYVPSGYGNNTPPNLLVQASYHADGTVLITARAAGAAGNGIPVSLDVGTDGAWSSASLQGGQNGGIVLNSVSEFTDLVGGTDVLYASKSSSSGVSTIKKLASAAWSNVRTMNFAYGYAAIWADGNEALYLETPLAVVMNLSKGIKLGDAVFWIVGTGVADAPDVMMIALYNGALQRIEVPA